MHRCITRQWPLAARVAVWVLGSFAAPLSAQEQVKETGSLQIGNTVVWVRATNHGVIQFFAAEGYRDAFAHPVLLPASGVGAFVAEVASASAGQPPTLARTVTAKQLGDSSFSLVRTIGGNTPGLTVTLPPSDQLPLRLTLPDPLALQLLSVLADAARTTQDMSGPPRLTVASAANPVSPSESTSAARPDLGGASAPTADSIPAARSGVKQEASKREPTTGEPAKSASTTAAPKSTSAKPQTANSEPPKSTATKAQPAKSDAKTQVKSETKSETKSEMKSASGTGSTEKRPPDKSKPTPPPSKPVQQKGPAKENPKVEPKRAGPEHDKQSLQPSAPVLAVADSKTKAPRSENTSSPLLGGSPPSTDAPAAARPSEAKSVKEQKPEEQKPAAEPKAVVESKPAAEPKPVVESKPAAEPKPAVESKPAAEPKGNSETKPEAAATSTLAPKPASATNVVATPAKSSPPPAAKPSSPPGATASLIRPPAPIAPDATVAPEKVETMVRAKDSVTALVRAHGEELAECYRQYGLRYNPDLAGPLSLGLEVSDSGTVANVKVTRRTWDGPAPADVEQCVRTSVREWRFAPAEPATEMIALTLQFRP